MLSRVATMLSRYELDRRLDAEILLAHVLRVRRVYLHVHPEYVLSLAQQADFEKLMNRCMLGEPIAYLTGHQAFWSINLQVNPATLIPRPDTELLVEMTLQIKGEGKKIVADLGTGSGAIGLALAHEKPAWEVYATDFSRDALTVAKENAKRLSITNITFCQGDWCDALPRCLFDIIVSNPPYVAQGDAHLAQSVFDYEPHAALFSNENGLSDIRQIIYTSLIYLKPGAYLLLEHGFQQAKDVHKLLANAGYIDIKTTADLAGLDRVTMAVKR